MCFPAILGAAGISAGTASSVATIGASVLSAGSMLAQGAAQKQAAKYNAKLAEREGKVAANQALAEQQDITRQRRQVAGAQRAAAAGQGRGFTGSALDVVQASETTTELDILSAVYGGQLGIARAKGDRNLAKAQARGAMPGAVFGAGTTLLTGVSKALY